MFFRKVVINLDVECAFLGVKYGRNQITSHWLDPGQAARLG